jgi:hypothetical protein
MRINERMYNLAETTNDDIIELSQLLEGIPMTTKQRYSVEVQLRRLNLTVNMLRAEVPEIVDMLGEISNYHDLLESLS